MSNKTVINILYKSWFELVEKKDVRLSLKKTVALKFVHDCRISQTSAQSNCNNLII
jgi:hypothetical protein